MKVRNIVFVVAGMLAWISIGIPATAQAQPVLRVNVPFEFYFATERFAAGSYVIARVGQTDVIRLWDEKKHSAITLTIAAGLSPGDPGKSWVIFNRYGDTYFLSEVRWREYGPRALPKSAAEVEVARNIARQRVIATTTNR